MAPNKPSAGGATTIRPPSTKELNKAAEHAQSQLLWMQDAHDGRGDDGKAKGKAMTFDLKQIMFKTNLKKFNRFHLKICIHFQNISS